MCPNVVAAVYGVVSGSSPVVYDYYLDAINGSDSNSGTAENEAWQTSGKLATEINALPAASSKTVLVKAGTYGSLYFTPTNTISAVLTFETGVTVDTTAGTDNGIGSSGTATITYHLNGATLTGTGTTGPLTPNGISGDDSATVIVYGTASLADGRGAITGFADGISAHNTSRVEVYRMTTGSNSKGGMVNVNTSTAYVEDCVINGTAAQTVGPVAHQSTGAIEYVRTQIVPATSGQAVELGRGLTTLDACVLGTTSARLVISNGNAVATEDLQFTDCYINASLDSRAKFTFTECYGRLTVRVRGASTIGDMVMNNCHWVGSASGTSTGLLYGNFDDGSANWEGVGYQLTNCIIRGYTTAIGAGLSAAQIARFNLESKAYYSSFFGNTTNYAATVTGTSQTGNITVDPLVGPSNTTVKSDYGFGSGSPCIGAGLSGADIGFAA